METMETRWHRQAAYDLDTKPTKPKPCEETGSNADEFDDGEYEVESQQKSESEVEEPHQNHVRKESLPADELFSDGKIMPLKPPPRLQYPNDKKFDKKISTLSSPRSPSGVLRLPFQRRSLWNDDFDPFMVALENVKEEKVGKSQPKSHRRSGSMSTIREIANDLLGSSQQQIKQMGLILPTQQSDPNSNERMESNGSTFLTLVTNKHSLMGSQEQVKQEKKSSLNLTELKGVLIGRPTRIVKVGHEKPRMPEVTCTKESKSQKIKNFLFRNASTRK